MIAVLHIKNIGIIEDLTIEFDEGLNILTGETGSGKTLIINSLNIISGARFSKEMMKNRAEFSFVEVCFYLPNHHKNEDGNVIVSREIHSNGRNLCKLNGRVVTVLELKEVVSKIIDIHGQNDNQSLLDVSNHIELLDEFSEKDISDLKKEYTEKYKKYIELKKELQENYGNDEEKQRTLDLLRYQLDEIENANLKLNEEEELEEKRKIVLNSKKINNVLNVSSQSLSVQVLEGLSTTLGELEQIISLNKEYEEIYNSIQSSYYELEESNIQIAKFKNDTFFDESEQIELQDRLDLIFNLKRKYGNTIEKILIYKSEIESQINKIENLEEHIKELKIQITKLEEELGILAEKIHYIREKMTNKLSEKINSEFKDLNMKNAIFKVRIDKLTSFNIHGLDDIEFMVRTNLGEEFKPLAKTASGGEISRIMLAIKTVLSQTDQIQVLVFDEIDTGISGASSNAVGEKLKYIAQNHQVLCITHLANIAAKGDANYYISKSDENGRTTTNIKKLEEQEVIEELARISSGKIDKVSLEYAKKLRN